MGLFSKRKLTQVNLRDDALYEDVKNEVRQHEYYTMTAMCRKFGVGYTRAGKIFNWLVEDGLLEQPADGRADARGLKVVKSGEPTTFGNKKERDSERTSVSSTSIRNVHEDEQDALIQEIRESMVTEADVRRIIAEELAKYFNKEEEKPSLTVISNNGAIEIVEEETKETIDRASLARIPFPTRMLEADQELKQCYNELKAEALAYGLKSRLSNSGDTFRLHAKTYMKIAIAGKSLKLYFALNPSDYSESSFPITDAGTKNLYKDIPLVFKVRSPLSVRRARQLLSDACKKDDLLLGKIVHRDWVSPLKDYKPQLGPRAELDE